MYTIKGFGRITELANNAIGVVPVLGELSSQSLTFGRERNRGYHLDETKGTVEFVSFSCKNLAGTNVPVPSTYSSLILSVTNWLYDRAKTLSLAATPALVAAQIAAEFNTQLQDVRCGELVSIGAIKLPTSVTFTKTEGTNNNLNQIWFSDAAFQLEYDGAEYVIIPPVEELDSLFESSPIVEGLLQRSYTDLFLLKQEAIGEDPPTTEVVEEHNRVSILSPTVLNTVWIVLQYGAAADDPDARRAALVAYILANSERPESEWRQLIPSLFVKTEFLIVPTFDQIAIPSQEVTAGLFSSFLSTTEITAYAALAAFGITGYAPFVESFPTTYKSLMCVGYGGQDNVGGIRALSVKFPDYINVHTSSVDFGRMSPDTQGWVNLLYRLIQAAETMTPTSGLVSGIKRVIRNNKVYAVATYKQTQYLVYAKSNFV